jgi:hypothetical protein
MLIGYLLPSKGELLCFRWPCASLRAFAPFADLLASFNRWYFYQKTKNYRVMYSGVLGGLKTGGRIGLWTATFVGLEEGIEAGVRRSLPASAASYRTRWASGGLAGLGLATAAGQICKMSSARRSADVVHPRFPSADRLSRYSAPRRMLLGASLGIIAGGSHDLRDWMKTKLPPSRD